MKFKSTKDVADLQSARNEASKRKSSFFASRFRNGQRLTVSGYDFVYDEDDTTTTKENRKAFPVLLTKMGENAFDHIFLSTLVREVVSADSKTLSPEGSLNVEAIRLVGDDSVKTDEEVLQKLVEFCKNKVIVVKRDRGYKRMLNDGRIMASVLLEFNVE